MDRFSLRVPRFLRCPSFLHTLEHPKDLTPAIERALDRVKLGEPALVDVITQPR